MNSTAGDRRLGRSALRAAILAAAATAALAVGWTDAASADNASASNNRVSSSPESGAVLNGAPTEFTLRMEHLVARADVEVVDGCGRTVPFQVSADGSRVAGALAPGGPTAVGGTWRMRWQVTGIDGRATAGDVPFTVRGDATCEARPQPSGSAATAGDGDRKDGAATAGAGGRGGDVRAAVAVVASSLRDGPVVPVGATTAAVFALAGLGLALRRRRKRA
jgi:methionine-rich copper-binding protein CopC